MNKKKVNKINKLVNLAAKNNTKEGGKHWDAIRLAEECTELAKELILYAHRPEKTTRNAIEEELGDVITRTELFLRGGAVDPERVWDRVIEKLQKYKRYVKSGERDLV